MPKENVITLALKMHAMREVDDFWFINPRMRKAYLAAFRFPYESPSGEHLTEAQIGAMDHGDQPGWATFAAGRLLAEICGLEDSRNVMSVFGAAYDVATGICNLEPARRVYVPAGRELLIFQSDYGRDYWELYGDSFVRDIVSRTLLNQLTDADVEEVAFELGKANFDEDFTRFLWAHLTGNKVVLAHYKTSRGHSTVQRLQHHLQELIRRVAGVRPKRR